ncbi:MAG: hypothetical protein ACE5GC_02310 [Acidimicrobiia bacterium]
MRKIVAALAAAGVLVAGAFTATVVVGGTATAQDATDEPPGLEAPERPKRGAILEGVLEGLVADGVITNDQAEQIVAALQEKAAELREEFGDRPLRRGRGFHPGPGRGFGPGSALLEDGVIDADELAGLPDDHPFNDPDGPAAAYLDDGELTSDELRQLHRELREQRREAREQRRAANGAEAVLTA